MLAATLRRSLIVTFCCLASFAAPLLANPLSRSIDVDFFRDVPSRSLKGLATRSDGRLVAGPVLTDLNGTPPADLLWTLEPTADPAKWLAGTGPEGKIVEFTIDATRSSYTSREVAKLDEPQVFALRRLPDGTLLAGTSPTGALYLLRDGEIVARVALPVDSIFDLLSQDGSSEVLVATGNPGRIYSVDIAAFAKAGISSEKISDPAELAARGIRQWSEIRDRNVRRLARLADGRVVAGSAPRGNIYTFPAQGGPPVVLQENRDAEVTDLLPQPNGDLYATLVFAGNTGESRINRPRPTGPVPPDAVPELAGPPERFAGRSSVVWFPASGFPETLVARGNLAFYRMVKHGDLLLVAGGDQGDLLGYDLARRNSLTFPGSAAAQLNAIASLGVKPGQFLALKNNGAGLALIDFSAAGPREAETRRLDLLVPSQIGALRFNRLRGVDAGQLNLTVKTNFGSDESEGWTEWTPLVGNDGGWRGEDLRGRYVKLRLQLPSASTESVQIDRASLFHLPQNRRPMLVEFRVITPNFGLIPAPEPLPQGVVSLSQLVGSGSSGGDSGFDKRKGSFMNSQVIAQPGTQLVFWNVNDADGDILASTFSLRRDGNSEWTDVAVNTRDSYAQFNVGHLPEGIYFTRLVVSEQAPRPDADRLTVTFETDDLVVDRTPPQILEATAGREGGTMRVSVKGRDAISLLDGAEFVFNNGTKETLQQPVDGIRDGREETFALEIPLSRIANATSVEIILYDASGNSTARRVPLPQ